MENTMIDGYFDQVYDEEFNKIPFVFRFSRGTKRIFIALIIMWAVIDFFLGSVAKSPAVTQIVAGRGIPVRTDFSSWVIFIIANCILVVILSWGVIGTVFERLAFKKASKLDRLHKDWMHERAQREIRKIKYDVLANATCHCPKCGLPVASGEYLCELCRSEQE